MNKRNDERNNWDCGDEIGNNVVVNGWDYGGGCGNKTTNGLQRVAQ